MVLWVQLQTNKSREIVPTVAIVSRELVRFKLVLEKERVA